MRSKGDYDWDYKHLANYKAMASMTHHISIFDGFIMGLQDGRREGLNCCVHCWNVVKTHFTSSVFSLIVLFNPQHPSVGCLHMSSCVLTASTSSHYLIYQMSWAATVLEPWKAHIEGASRRPNWPWKSTVHSMPIVFPASGSINPPALDSRPHWHSPFFTPWGLSLHHGLVLQLDIQCSP